MRSSLLVNPDIRARRCREIEHRLRALGLRGVARVVAHRNRRVVLSVTPSRVLRVHEGFALAPDRVLKAIVRYVRPGTPRLLRRAALNEIVTFPVESIAPPEPTVRRPHPGEAPLLTRLEALHATLNERHFGGALGAVTFRLSGRMRERLGEFTAARSNGRGEIAISGRHIRRDGWSEVEHTLLHEMIHQWQAEHGKPVDHGREFRRMARHLGILPRARRPVAGASRLPS